MTVLQSISQTEMPSELPEVYHIEADQSLIDRPLRVLKQGDMFGLFDNHGDFCARERGPDGLFFNDMRHLSNLELRLGGKRPLLLDSVVLDDNSALLVDLTNADLHDPDGKCVFPRDTIFASRLKFLDGRTCYERISVRSFDAARRRIALTLAFDADFADLFEVRGEARPRRGTVRRSQASDRALDFTYLGLDGVTRFTSIAFDPPPTHLDAGGARWDLDLEPSARFVIVANIVCGQDDQPRTAPIFLAAYRRMRTEMREKTAGFSALSSSNELFNAIAHRASADIDMLLTETEYGLYPYAGVPWYSTIFGRDGIITALQTLWHAPRIAQGVLLALARTQATDHDPAADAQPGKILHEMRGGEMAILGEVPFRRYYGTVDATPLFVLLAGAYFRRSGDAATIRTIWPNIEAALGWIDTFGDADGDGFVEYARQTDRGLVNQGWKDSHDSIFHADGSLAEGPIALVEVQAYVHAAKHAAGEMAAALGMADLAVRLIEEAETLRRSFEQAFWLDDLGTYALALDGRKQPCRVLSSNAGHALYAGIAAPDRAARVAQLFASDRFFTGWGIRTIATGEARYNPMSYHNGSVWPHDNALIALGLARYGHKALVKRLFTGLFESATYDDLGRLPELFCGFPRRRQRGPTSYPVACSPQAWAAATPFALIAAATGLDIDHAADCVRFDDPALPAFLDELLLPPLELGGSRLRIRLRRSGGDVTVAAVDRQGPARILIAK